ncbi:hypothetical protein XPA_006247 [Xanthoria parietina]
MSSGPDTFLAINAPFSRLSSCRQSLSPDLQTRTSDLPMPTPTKVNRGNRIGFTEDQQRARRTGKIYKLYFSLEITPQTFLQNLHQESDQIQDYVFESSLHRGFIFPQFPAHHVCTPGMVAST